MATIEKFEDIIAWQKARKFAHDIFLATKLNGFEKDFSLADQINRSSGSTMDNIAEGFERGGNKEFIQFLFIAKSSIGETRSQLYRAYDRGYISETLINEFKNRAVEISGLIGGLINYLQNSDIKGTKHKFSKQP